MVKVASEGMSSRGLLQHIRSGVRVNSRVPLLVEWNEAGARHSVEGYTVDISPKGCMAVVPQGFATGQKLFLTNLSNHEKSEATLVWKGHEGRTGWELGLQLDNPPEGFWGVEF